ncbi:MAG: pyridoxal-phosphate dependent enzyme [Lewinellaceae bacterium]|nr:pyridoxal-phosphate dependent enzyme [Saprospiraceae bacterium]MCB9333739.1 pyridoxal-phosphate dependent enzyme [Lewinellaceae bacterium]
MEKDALLQCHEKIRPYIHRTPVMTSRLLNELSGAELFFKCENLQRMGAFKMRGAMHAILNLSPDQQQRGVVTHSSGNFAQAIALAAASLGLPAYIVMPSNAPTVKKSAVEAYGGKITECTPTIQAREATASQIQQETGATFLHPFDDHDVILGQGTAALELLEDFPDLDYLLAPVGGGGLISGTALAAHFFGKNCQTIGAEPFAVDDAYRSLQSGKIETNTTTETIADGLKTNLGEKTFPLIQQYVQKIIRVEESEIVTAMRLIWERMKIVVEPSGAVPFAAILRAHPFFEKKKVGLILSGGNVDLTRLPF